MRTLVKVKVLGSDAECYEELKQAVELNVWHVDVIGITVWPRSGSNRAMVDLSESCSLNNGQYWIRLGRFGEREH